MAFIPNTAGSPPFGPIGVVDISGPFVRLASGRLKRLEILRGIDANAEVPYLYDGELWYGRDGSLWIGDDQRAGPYQLNGGSGAVTSVNGFTGVVVLTSSDVGAQPVDATLTALAGLTIAANSIILGTGADAFSDLALGANTIPGRSSAGNVVAKSVTDAGFAFIAAADAAAETALLDAMVGDTGTGGTKGLVPAPAAGDAAALKFLKADGTFAVPAGTGSAATDGNFLENVGGVQASVPVDLVVNGRLTLTSGTPVTTTDVTGAQTVYFTPYKGNRITLYDGTRAQPVTFSEQSIKMTDTQTGSTTTGSKIVTGLTDTSKFFVGMLVTNGTPFAASTTIVTIDSATQVTVFDNAATTGSYSLVFELPGLGVLDIFGVLSGGALILRPGTHWTTATVRADTVALVNGRYMNTSAVRSGQYNPIAANTGLLLGTICATAGSGSVEDSASNRHCWNAYNRVRRNLSAVESTTASWNYTTATWRESQGLSTLGRTRVSYVCGISEDMIRANVQALLYNASLASAAVGVGVDSTTTPSSQIMGAWCNATANGGGIARCSYEGFPGIGHHVLSWLEISRAAGTTTWYGIAGGAEAWMRSGLNAEIMA